MTSPDDLTGLFTSDDRDTDTPFRQGTIVTFNTLTGANTINVAGAILTDVPLLNIGDTVNLLPNDVVVLMKMKSAWAILGRVLVPNSAAISSSAIATEAHQSFASNFAVTTSFVTYTSFDITTPPWANRALVTVQAYANVASGTATTFQLRSLIGGVASSALNGYIVAGQIGSNSMGQALTFTATPSGVYTIEAQISAAIAVAINTFTAVLLVGTAIYSKV